MCKTEVDNQGVGNPERKEWDVFTKILDIGGSMM